jgi:hypothetical protein
MSKTIGGIWLAVGGLVLVQFGFSDSCSNEIVAKLSPILGAAPGLALAWWARKKKGDVNAAGIKKF